MRFNTIGTDTELFAQDKEGKLISLCGKIGGTKENPTQIIGYSNGFALQEDNVSIEFNIPPVICVDQWCDSITRMIIYIQNEKLNNIGLSICKEASATFSEDELQHPQALIFGCEPDFNAWTGDVNEKPFCNNFQLRTAGGHVHVGTSNNMIDATQAMDLFLGVPSVILDCSPASIIRKKLYGKAGAMRPKPYGFEYRVLSNFWVFDRELIEWVFYNTKDAMNSNIKFTKKRALEIQECINTNDIELAKSLCNIYNIPLPLL